MTTLLKELLGLPRFSDLRVLNKAADLNRVVASIEITETPDVAYYISKNVLILTTAMMFEGKQHDLIAFIDSLVAKEAAGLAIKVNRFLGEIDKEVLAYADEKGFPLIRIPGTLPLGSLLHQMLNFLWDAKQEETTYAMDIQRTFSNLLMNDANISHFTTEFGKMIKTPVILLNPFYEIIAYSKHFNQLKRPASHFAEQVWQREKGIQTENNNYLIKDMDGQELHIAVYPLKVYNHFPHYLLVLKPEKIPYPISSFAIEQAAMVLSFTLYKNLKVEESKQRLQSDILVKLIEDREALNRSKSNLVDVGTPFGLHYSTYNQIAFINCSTSDDSDERIRYNEEKMQLTLAWFQEKLANLGTNVLLVLPEHSSNIVLLIQAEIKNLEQILTEVAEGLEDIIPVEIRFFFGGAHDSVEKLSESFIEAKIAWESFQPSLNTSRIHHFRPEGLKQLFTHSSPEEVRYFATSVLKELAYPEDESHMELRRTMKQYLDNQCEITKTANHLFVHRNTVKYRIERCEQIIGQKLNDPVASLNIRLALELTQSPDKISI